MPCDYGTYAPPPGGYTACIPCPGGVLTPNMMSDGLEDCTGPDYCSVPGVCSQDTDCVLGGPNGYECECKEGFRTLPGGGCLAVCGDSQVRGNETCDDGNVVSDDGCSDEVMCMKQSHHTQTPFHPCSRVRASMHAHHASVVSSAKVSSEQRQDNVRPEARAISPTRSAPSNLALIVKGA